jgi:hypothetical protein
MDAAARDRRRRGRRDRGRGAARARCRRGAPAFGCAAGGHASRTGRCHTSHVVWLRRTTALVCARPPMNKIFAAAVEVEAVCRAEGFRSCFIGGLAVQRWGQPRMTADVDITVITGFGNEAPYVDALLSKLRGRIPDARELRSDIGRCCSRRATECTRTSRSARCHSRNARSRELPSLRSPRVRRSRRAPPRISSFTRRSPHATRTGLTSKGSSAGKVLGWIAISSGASCCRCSSSGMIHRSSAGFGGCSIAAGDPA